MTSNPLTFCNRQLKRKIFGKAATIAPDGLIEDLRRHPIQPGQIRIENHSLIANHKNQRFQWLMDKHSLCVGTWIRSL